MKRITMVGLIAGLLIAGVALAAASNGSDTPRIDQREANQRARTNQGVKSGQLTRRETRSVRRDQKHIRRMERRAKRDGNVTPQERRRITKAQNHESKKIHRLKHNERTRK